MIGILLLLNVLAQYFYGYIDMTEEKRYTLTEPTKEVVGKVKDNISVKILMNGEFPAAFKRLRTASIDMLKEFKSISPFIEYDFEDPNEGTVEQINQRRMSLSKDGINPVSLGVVENNESSKQIIYPYAIFRYGNRKQVVNLLEPSDPRIGQDEVLNNSVSLLEYKMANAVQKLFFEDEPIIAIVEGHGELDEDHTKSFEKDFRQNNFITRRLNLDSVAYVHPSIDILLIAKPQSLFSNGDKFKIDQYLMNGGNVIFLIDKLKATLDSMQITGNYVPREIELDLDDLLFKYGARIESNLVLDLQCTQIPLRAGEQGGKPQFEFFPWFYHILTSPASNHPIVKNLDRVNLLFPSSIDTIKTKAKIKKTSLLTSSEYTRYQRSPVRLNFEILRYTPDESKFNKDPQTLALLLEGEFVSAFENRTTEKMRNALNEIGSPFKANGDKGKVLVVSDGDIIKNVFKANTNEYSPMGYNVYESRVYEGNKAFLQNAIEYMIDKDGILASRSKEVKLRMLDKVKAKTEKTKWQLINIALPLFFLAIFGFLFNYLRRRKFAH
jgi:gliding-associated putative ABC transporter substrate-binding component GldG